MLDAFSGLHGEWECHFIGDGSDAEICQAYAHQLDIADHLHWHGWQEKPWEYVQTEIKQVSAFVMSSAFEGLPMTMGFIALAAIAHRDQVISSRTV
ncbi:MAG: glycosyltransferase [Symbiopectobacterium sp.]|uniref:glycosyltransferase n=1 Tax=Symbiopectobacterium sp. TaxID=2952789 RepID=UPI003F38C78E